MPAAALQKQCFLLTHSYSDQQSRFQVTLYAQTNEGVPLVASIDTFRPLFFVLRAVPPGLTAECVERKPLEMRTLNGEAIDCLYFTSVTAAQHCATRLRQKGFRPFESDVGPVDRFLMERGVKGSFVCEGPISLEQGMYRARNPKIRGAETSVELSVLSLDIETNGRTDEIYSIACHGTGDRVFVVGEVRNEGPIRHCRDEREVLVQFLAHVAREDPDVLVGWNVIDFDLRVLQDRCRLLEVPFLLGRGAVGRITPSRQNPGQHNARIPGRVVLDGPTMLRSFFHTFEEYSLDFVASEMLGKQKLVRETGAQKIAAINRLYQENKAALAEYNLEDARLTKEIFDRAGILPSAIQRSKLSGHLIDRTGGSVAAFDHLYLPRLHRAGYVAGDVMDAPRPMAGLQGGYVMDPVVGIHENVLVFDFKSLYPSLIMTFKIDPLGFHQPSDDQLPNPAGTSFSKRQDILPGIISELLAARADAKRTNNSHLSQAIKILMNSFYGVLGTPGCRFFDARLAETITGCGQYILKETARHIEETFGHRVIYGDTDSLFVLLGPGLQQRAAEIGSRIVADVNAWLRTIMSERFGAESALELEFETHFRHALFPSVRGGGQGSKKHYCGATPRSDGTLELSFTGMESVRSDWTDLAKEFQHELCMRLFTRQPVEEYVRSMVAAVKRGDHDARLVYRKRLRKSVEEYTKPVPPHVQAARLLENPGLTIRYFITVSGPQPEEKLSAPLDYDHYIDAQLKPIADTLLEGSGVDFGKIVSAQTDLFG